LAGDPAHAPTVQRLAATLRERLDPAAVDREAKADQNALVARFGGRAQALLTGPAGATPAPAS